MTSKVRAWWWFCAGVGALMLAVAGCATRTHTSMLCGPIIVDEQTMLGCVDADSVPFKTMRPYVPGQDRP